MEKAIKTINFSGYKAEVYENNIIIKEKAEAHSITLNASSKTFMFIKYLMMVNEAEMRKFIEYYARRVFTHVHLMSDKNYAPEYEEFFIKYSEEELNQSLSPDDPNALDELRKLNKI